MPQKSKEVDMRIRVLGKGIVLVLMLVDPILAVSACGSCSSSELLLLSLVLLDASFFVPEDSEEDARVAYTQWRANNHRLNQQCPGIITYMTCTSVLSLDAATQFPMAIQSGTNVSMINMAG